MFELFVERRRLGNFVEDAVDLDPLEAAFLKLRQLLPVFALSSANDRSEQEEPGFFRQCQHPIDHLADCLTFDRQAGGRRIWDADPRPEQTHVVMNFGDGAYR